MTVVLDVRLNAFRGDLADARLREQVQADRFVEGAPTRIVVPVADLRRIPSPEAGIETQLLLGDEVKVFDRHEGWAWVQAKRDGYVGYVQEAGLAGGQGAPSTHRVSALRTFVYPEPELKSPPLCALSIGSSITVASREERRGNRYAILADGTALFADHLAPAKENASDFVAIAEAFLHTPYLWGGTSAFGVDCSGLVQLSMYMAGRAVRRDTDMQEASIGTPMAPQGDYGNLRRGDLVFWKGHVGIMTDGENILHANGRTMTVALEPLKAAIERIMPLFGKPTSVRRP